MHVIGTAGHVDHGKSTLIAALTGIHPDRLKEERERGMTIDLGFAWLTLPNGESVGIVDVPGHRDFIENMLAGVGGIDAALLVIAADEGVMPQTREHLLILDLLKIPRGVIALSKIDLIDDPEWLDLVEAEIRSAVQGTILQDAPIVRVSAQTRQGLDALVNALVQTLENVPPQIDSGKPRLPIDRVFSIAGFGTIVTGTLTHGSLALGEEVEILPPGLRGRIRGLQTHKRKTQRALPGSRTAVNISGVEVSQLRRGFVLTHPGDYTPTTRIDAQCHLIREASAPLRHSQEVKVFIGTAEVLARVRVLGDDEITPGEDGWVQLELRHPVVADRNDRFILRRPSPGETIGGGVVLDPHPPRRHRRFDEAVLQRFIDLSRGSPLDLTYQTLQSIGPLSLKETAQRTGMAAQEILALVQSQISPPLIEVLDIPGGTKDDLILLTHKQWQELTQKAQQELGTYHQQYPLRRGMPREALKSRLRLSPPLFQGAMARWIDQGILNEGEHWVQLPQHQVLFSPQQQRSIEDLLQRFTSSPYAPPTIKECIEIVGEEIFNALVENRTLAPVSEEVVFRKEDHDSLVHAIVDILRGEGSITVAQFRDRFQTSRRYALAFLEYLDARGVTQRQGDVRRLSPNGEKLAKMLTD